ncbi:MAG: SH3 domain-containing protein [Reyranella sp.]|nr:SH3 domain-containing protein [Reyranella sp.]
MSRSPFRVLPATCLLLVTASGVVSEVDADSAGIAPCAISAWSTDRDPRGLDVRAGPGTGSPVIARLPPPLEVAGYTFAAEVSITGSKDGWFRIDSAILNDYVDAREPEVVFKGEGWVSGRRLGLLLNHGDLHRGPTGSAPVVARLVKEDPDGKRHGPDSFIVDRLDACRGNWVEVEGTFLGARLRGWATGTCSNQVTTCP